MRAATLLEKWISRLKNHKIFAAALFIGIAVIAIATFSDAVDKLLVFSKLNQMP